MANTLNLGNGNWATKEDSLLAYNSENGNFKPLPFDFTRASSATVVNKAGLIETVGSGEPRIDFKDDAKGALLLEPTRSNLVTYSNDFSQGYWTKSNSSITSNSLISPDGGLNADKLIASVTTTSHWLSTPTITVTATTLHTLSVFIKTSEFTKIGFREGFTGQQIALNLTDKSTLFSSGSSTSVNYVDYGNGFTRIELTYTSSGSGSSSWRVFLLDNSYTSGNLVTYNYLGNGTSGIYIYGAQLEQGSYATSYIPTQGSAVTRSADACNNGGNEQVINSTEGVLYAEISALANDGTSRSITIGDGTASNRVFLKYTGTDNQIESTVVSNNVVSSIMNYVIPNALNANKVALKYKLNDFSLWVNGFEVATDILGNAPIALNALNFDNGVGGSPFYGNTKDLRVYNTALTDQELQALTT